ncbi:MAG: SH3 domain-containing protein [Plectolyngbya sp. WJT66-NPBG17]|nr:SH3 domain-containing protein [Plectolyngbya sp. WJT66-NPBG17]
MIPLHASWSRFTGCVALLALVAGCSSAPQSSPVATVPSPSVSPSPIAPTVSDSPIANPQSVPTQPNPEPAAPISAPSKASRTVEKCVIRMAKVNDPESPLNVRSSPNATSKDNIVGQLGNGAFVEVKDEQNGWFRIEDETPGWIAKSKTENNCGEKIERVEFGEGQDEIQIVDRFIGVGTHTYRLNLAKGQRLTITSDRGGVFPMVIAPNGKNLVSSPEQQSPWTGELTETGDYKLMLDSNYKGYQYAFSVNVR